ncbi:MAG: polysaccharide biosynthesis tyrosine autokinase, partial [Pseudomonadota bacterium]
MENSSNNSAYSSQRDQDIDLRSLLLLIRRRWQVFVACILSGIALAMIIAGTLAPQYTARSIVLLEMQNTRSPMDNINQVLGTKIDSSVIMNELEIMRSSTMASHLIRRLNLMADPEFNPRFRDLEKNKERVDAAFRNLSLYGSELQTFPREVFDEDLADVGRRILENLRVRALSGSYAIQIKFTSKDPSKAALIANKIADLYIEQRMEQKYRSTRRMTDILDKRLADLRNQLRVAEERVEQYRAKHNLLEGAQATALSAERLSKLNEQLIAAKTDRAEAMAKLEQMQDMGMGSATAELLSGLTNAALLRELKSEEAALKAEISELSSRYGKKHPEMITRRDKLSELRKVRAEEIENLSGIIHDEVDYAEARIEVLEAELGHVTTQIHEDNAAMIGLREFEREAEVARLLFDRFLESYKRSDEQEKIQDADARIISYATVPPRPSFPNKKLIFAISLLLSAVTGLIVSVIFEKLDNSYRNGAHLEDDLAFPCYGLIPAVKNISKAELADYVLDHPSAAAAEAVRTLRMVLNLRAKDKKPKVVALTSSFSGEGKTTLSLWLARLTAKAGDKVIVIDSDLRRPNLHVALGLPNEYSLVDYLSGDKALEDVVHKDQQSGAHMIFGQSVPHAALDLVTSEKL